MGRVDAAAASDRLPWLPDEPQAKPTKRDGNSVLVWAGAAVVIVAGSAFWLGTRSVEEQPASSVRHAAPATTVPLPEARSAERAEVQMPAQPEVNPSPAPQVRPAPTREVRIAAPVDRPAVRETANNSAPADKAEQAVISPTGRPAQMAAPVVAAPKPQAVPLRPWNPRIAEGAAGRLVQVGAFGSISQAKRGWWFMVRAYPGMSRLPAVVRPSRNSHGRIFYRFQVGTTSQAHSEILCQRMQRIRLSCAVVGLPWKAKVER
jgi:hypothetical protein